MFVEIPLLFLFIFIAFGILLFLIFAGTVIALILSTRNRTQPGAHTHGAASSDDSAPHHSAAHAAHMAAHHSHMAAHHAAISHATHAAHTSHAAHCPSHDGGHCGH